MSESDPGIEASERRLRRRNRRRLIYTLLLLVGIAAGVAYKAGAFRRKPPVKEFAKAPRFELAATDANETREVTQSFENPVATSLELIGAVSLYHQFGTAENYGCDVRERRTKPIRLDSTVLHIQDNQAWILWWPDRHPIADDADLVEAAFEKLPTMGKCIIGLITSDHRLHAFGHEFAPGELPAGSDVAPLHFPTDLGVGAERANAKRMTLVGSKLRSVLPQELRDALRKDGRNAIRCWFVNFVGCKGQELGLRNVSLLRRRSEPLPDLIDLQGKVGGAEGEVGVELRTESGQVRNAKTTNDGAFTFSKVSATDAVSIRVHRDAQDHFARQGVWFVPSAASHDLAVDVAPSYRNENGHKPDPAARVVHVINKPGFSEHYAAHARQVWNGDETLPQEFEGKTFTNNIGHIDRDRFQDNPDGTIRVVHLGSSHAVACQVRICDRYNILLEADLSVRLQRPVEVISLGRNNGDLAANFVRIRDYAVYFKPDLILIEHGSALMTQIQPDLLKRMLGYDAKHSPLDSFYYDADGRLQHRPSSSDWAAYAGKQDLTPLTPNVPFKETLRVPFARMHPWGKEAYKLTADLLREYKKRFPPYTFMLHTGLDQAQAHGKYEQLVEIDGERVPIGAGPFVRNLQSFARQEGFQCIHPALPVGFNDADRTYLTFLRDGHFSPRGHQWLARELVPAVAEYLSDRPSLSSAKSR